MSITSDVIRGHTDTIILAQLILGDSYGYKINKAIKYKTDSRYELKEATAYSSLKRLEESGAIRSYWGNDGKDARRRYYSITELGRDMYYSLVADWEDTKTIIDRLIRID